MRVFVTGGSGFIGGHVIEGFSSDHEVLAMARSDRSAAAVRDYGATAVACDLSAVRAEHLEGCQAVVHCAAYVEEYGPRSAFFDVNVTGTQAMLDAARQAGVSRFVHVGTEAVLFDGRDLVDVDEDTPGPMRHRYLYPETKAEAERRVLSANGDGMATMSVRPRLVWGPRDATILPGVLRMLDAGSWTWLDGGTQRTSTTHVHNLVHGLRLALERGEGGQAYFVADEEVHVMRDFVTALAATRGRVLPDRSVPSWAVRAAASAVERSWRLLGIRSMPPVTRLAAAMMSTSVTVSTAKARRVLGYAPIVDFERGLRSMQTT